jgi:hypothetical protein
MHQPADTLQLTQEEQGRLLARVYAYILSDQFIGKSQETSTTTDTRSKKKRKIQSTGEAQVLDAEINIIQEPTL